MPTPLFAKKGHVNVELFSFFATQVVQNQPLILTKGRSGLCRQWALVYFGSKCTTRFGAKCTSDPSLFSVYMTVQLFYGNYSGLSL
jgi:hypothetical protein